MTGSVGGNYFRQPYSVTHTRKAVDENLPTEKASLAERLPSRVSIPLDGESVEFSAVLLRDACSCPACVHESTKQRLFSTADIPTNVHARAVEVDALSESASITWENDVPGYSKEHVTELSMAALRNIVQSGQAPGSHRDSFLPPVLWSQEPLNLPDYDYDAYMKDDHTLYQLISQLRTEGLAFVTNIPGLEESLATIATRIGPIKDTFYGQTWDGTPLDTDILGPHLMSLTQSEPFRQQSMPLTPRTIWVSTRICCISSSPRISNFCTVSSLPLQVEPAYSLMHSRQRSTCFTRTRTRSIPWPLPL